MRTVHRHPPLCTTDPVAAMELLGTCTHVQLTNLDDGWFVLLQVGPGHWGKNQSMGSAATLEAAIAEAWLAAHEAQEAKGD